MIFRILEKYLSYLSVLIRANRDYKSFVSYHDLSIEIGFSESGVYDMTQELLQGGYVYTTAAGVVLTSRGEELHSLLFELYALQEDQYESGLEVEERG